MLSSIIKYNKVKDVFNIKEQEVWLSIIFSCIVCIILNGLNFYNDFHLYVDTLNSVIGCFMGGLLGIVGFSLSGMAIMLGLFSRKQIETIEKVNGKNVIEKIMSSYVFLAFVSAINVLVLLIILFAISSNIQIIQKLLFWVLAYLIIYMVTFNMFYAVALVSNCISLYSISKLYNVEKNVEILPIANEIRIDFIMGVVVNLCQISREEVLKQLEKEGANLPEETKGIIRDYFENHYAKDSV